MGTTVTAAGSAAQSISSGTSSGKANLDVSDFYNLLAAQLKNQSMLKPVDDTQLISQMAQFSALSSTQQLNSTFSNFMSVSYIGKNVVAQVTDKSGTNYKIEGVAQKVEFMNGETYITVNGIRVTPNEIVEVSAVTAAEVTKTTETTETTETTIITDDKAATET